VLPLLVTSLTHLPLSPLRYGADLAAVFETCARLDINLPMGAQTHVRTAQLAALGRELQWPGFERQPEAAEVVPETDQDILEKLSKKAMEMSEDEDAMDDMEGFQEINVEREMFDQQAASVRVSPWKEDGLRSEHFDQQPERKVDADQ